MTEFDEDEEMWIREFFCLRRKMFEEEEERRRKTLGQFLLTQTTSSSTGPCLVCLCFLARKNLMVYCI